MRWRYAERRHRAALCWCEVLQNPQLPMRSFAASERQETAALPDFNPVYVGLGSKATQTVRVGGRSISALPPIATGLMRHSEASLSANNSGHSHCSKFAIHYAAALPAGLAGRVRAPLERKS